MEASLTAMEAARRWTHPADPKMTITHARDNPAARIPRLPRRQPVLLIRVVTARSDQVRSFEKVRDLQ
jgi:hypothetical protein